ncbi:monooxygenase [Streptomyces sp. CB02923]|uniref:FAD-dependent monooxygenase n=1 Tax=Streptomyces sp. CB02923 TaxID=1718985 RepID=UPI000938B78C|nr:FAD-dependent monooxygenase [Streptomyces sp. CB02923]OKI00790.1 monooxygenase [Streptomyces sp. CB02923]
MHGGTVAVVGGSIAGCAAALAAHRGGAGEVTVYERSDNLADYGAGLGMHNARYAELESAGYMDADMPCLQLTRRRWYTRDGSLPLGRQVGELPLPFRTYTWGPLWRELRDRLPATTVFRGNSPVRTVETSPDGAAVRLEDGSAHRADLVIGADGYRSVVRGAAFPGVRPAYAGYVAWRGAYPAGRLTALGPDPDTAWPVEDCVFAVFPGGHAVIYRIPDGEGGHRVNWVLYTVPPPELDLGLDTPTSLPPGTLGEALHASFAQVTGELLPPYWGGLLQLTQPDELFIQPMYDFTAPHYGSGRLLLAGDAATVARPHTGGGAVKALQDATALETAFAAAADWSEVPAAYDAARGPVGASMVELGRRLGDALVLRSPDWRTVEQGQLDALWSGAGPSAFGGRELPGARGPAAGVAER